jgi:ribosomal protein S12 methylthiotransferase
MVEALAATPGLERLRLMYLQPAELTVPLIETIAGHPKVASYFDLSLQHVSGPVVRRMARSGDHVRFAGLIERIRDLDPDAVFRSNFILGFPGETEQDVQVLEDFLVEQRLDWVGLFAYSPEDGTPAATMPDQVDPDEAPSGSSGSPRSRSASPTRPPGRSWVASCRSPSRTTSRTVRAGDDRRPLLPRGTGHRRRDRAGHRGPGRALIPADLPRGRTVTAEVVDAVGVDLVARVRRSRA